MYVLFQLHDKINNLFIKQLSIYIIFIFISMVEYQGSAAVTKTQMQTYLDASIKKRDSHI